MGAAKSTADRPVQAESKSAWRCWQLWIVLWGLLGLGLVATSWNQSANDLMAQHYKGAQSALRSGNLVAADSEYKAFLAEAVHRAANAQARTGDLSSAARSLEEDLNLSTNGSSIQLDLASVLFDQGRFKEAEVPARAAVEADPKNATAQRVYGQILFENKDYAGAVEHLQSASDLGDFAHVWRTLSLAYLRLGQVNHADAVLRQMIARFGNTPQNRITAALVFYYGDDTDRAAEELKKVIAEHPSAPDAHYYLGLTYLARNEQAGFAKAVPEFRAELQVVRKDFRSHYMLGYIALQERRFTEAEPELLLALSLNPHDAGTKLLLGELYSETKRTSKAEQTLRAIVADWHQDSPPDFGLVRAHYMLGRILRENGQLDEGAKEIKLAEDLRKQLRSTSTEASDSRVKSQAFALSDARGSSSQAKPDTNDRAMAKSFLAQISPMIGEAYYNLAGIAMQHKDAAVASHYLQLASQWDPSLAQAQH